MPPMFWGRIIDENWIYTSQVHEQDKPFAAIKEMVYSKIFVLPIDVRRQGLHKNQGSLAPSFDLSWWNFEIIDLPSLYKKLETFCGNIHWWNDYFRVFGFRRIITFSWLQNGSSCPCGLTLLAFINKLCVHSNIGCFFTNQHLPYLCHLHQFLLCINVIFLGRTLISQNRPELASPAKLGSDWDN